MHMRIIFLLFLHKKLLAILISSKDIPRGELHPCLEGKKAENKAKNRYTTIFPCMSTKFYISMKK